MEETSAMEVIEEMAVDLVMVVMVVDLAMEVMVVETSEVTVAGATLAVAAISNAHYLAVSL